MYARIAKRFISLCNSINEIGAVTMGIGAMESIKLALFATALAGIVLIGSAKAAGILLLAKPPAAVCVANSGQMDFSACSNAAFIAAAM
jgi:hypothetical protein